MEIDLGEGTEAFIKLADYYHVAPERLAAALIYTFTLQSPSDLTLISRQPSQPEAHAEYDVGSL